jgi:2-oxo-4-hydroxy-4-carboxy-5-ureidoimidazoline decarboxylase
VKLEEFNAMTHDEAAAVVRLCADVPAWVDEVVAARPYDDLDELFTVAKVAAEGWSDDEVDAALAQHPRIGERAAGDTEEAALSRSEQSAIGGEDVATKAAIRAGNEAYEQRFGRVFLIRAAGRSASEVLDQLTARLDNDPEAETAVVAGQLREIALLRLEGMFT